MAIHRMKMEDGQWCEDEATLKNQAVEYYRKQFTSASHVINPNILAHIPSLLTFEDNEALIAIPVEEEIKDVIHSMAPDSAPGPDGYTGKFFICFWDVISKDVTAAVQAFFKGMSLPTGFTSSLIAMIPKVSSPATFADMRPISLCNFIYKIISRVISSRLECILPRIISPNQGAFVKGRNIVETISMASEMMKEIGRKVRGNNIILKLDMEKAYDKMEWDFILSVMKSFGFCNRFCSFISMMLSNCWFSVLFNGSPTGFFKSSRGVRQGDPIAPALFIIAEEALSRGITSLFNCGKVQHFQVPRGCPPVTHLLYADDTLIFLTGMSKHIKCLLQFIKDYEASSGQKVNNNKSSFIITRKASAAAITRVSNLTGFQHKTGLQSYLGVPLYEGRKRISQFKELMDKICRRVSSWKSKYLSMAGRRCLINSVLQSIPLYTASALCLPVTVIRFINKVCANFLWAGNDTPRHHWVSWSRIVKPFEEGGLEIKDLHYTQIALVAKQIWNAIHGNSIWSSYAQSRYIKNHLVETHKPFPAGVRNDIFRHAKELILSNVRWIPMNGEEIDVLRDNWSGTPLAPHCDIPRTTLKDVIEDQSHQAWSYIPQHLTQTVKGIQLVPKQDKCIWAESMDGNFTCKSAYNAVRSKGQSTPVLRKLWGNLIPPRASLFGWRLLHNAVPVDHVIRNLGCCMPSKCVCCKANHQEECFNHLFMESHLGNQAWSYFRFLFPSFGRNSRNLHTLCWDVLHRADQQSPMGCAAILTMLLTLWEIWKARCKWKYEGAGPSPAIVQQRVKNQAILLLQKASFQKASPHTEMKFLNDQGIVFRLKERIPILVKWKSPTNGVALNVDGAAKGNPGHSGGGGCIRGTRGEFVFGFSYYYGIGSNMTAEARAMLDGMRFLANSGIQTEVIYSDSRTLTNMLLSNNPPPWTAYKWWEEMKDLIAKNKWNIQHIYREGNSVADALASLACYNQSNKDFRCWKELPLKVRGLLTVDAAGLPNWRM